MILGRPRLSQGFQVNGTVNLRTLWPFAPKVHRRSYDLFLWACSRASSMPHFGLCCLMLHFMNSLEAMPKPKWFERTCKICKSHGVVLFWHWRTPHSCRLKRSWAKYITVSLQRNHSKTDIQNILQKFYLVMFGPNFLLFITFHVQLSSCNKSGLIFAMSRAVGLTAPYSSMVLLLWFVDLYDIYIYICLLRFISRFPHVSFSALYGNVKIILGVFDPQCFERVW